MGRSPCCDKSKVKKGPWSPEEDETLINYIQNFGTGGNWISLPTKAGLKRCGKSCRLRWLNYLRPDIKHGGFTDEEDNIIYSLYCKIGSRWSLIASQLPGRTDNDIKNHWNTKLKKKLVSRVFENNFYETNFENPGDAIFRFQNPTSFGTLIPGTDSDFSLNSNISNLLDQSSPSMASTYTQNYSYDPNLNYTTSPIGDNISGFSAFPMESNMSHYGYSGISHLGNSENLETGVGVGFASGIWAQEVISEFEIINYSNLGNESYQGVTNPYLKIEG